MLHIKTALIPLFVICSSTLFGCSKQKEVLLEDFQKACEKIEYKEFKKAKISYKFTAEISPGSHKGAGKGDYFLVNENGIWRISEENDARKEIPSQYVISIYGFNNDDFNSNYLKSDDIEMKYYLSPFKIVVNIKHYDPENEWTRNQKETMVFRDDGFIKTITRKTKDKAPFIDINLSESYRFSYQ